MLSKSGTKNKSSANKNNNAKKESVDTWRHFDKAQLPVVERVFKFFKNVTLSTTDCLPACDKLKKMVIDHIEENRIEKICELFREFYYVLKFLSVVENQLNLCEKRKAVKSSDREWKSYSNLKGPHIHEIPNYQNRFVKWYLHPLDEVLREHNVGFTLTPSNWFPYTDLISDGVTYSMSINPSSAVDTVPNGYTINHALAFVDLLQVKVFDGQQEATRERPSSAAKKTQPRSSSRLGRASTAIISTTNEVVSAANEVTKVVSTEPLDRPRSPNAHASADADNDEAVTATNEVTKVVSTEEPVDRPRSPNAHASADAHNEAVSATAVLRHRFPISLASAAVSNEDVFKFIIEVANQWQSTTASELSTTSEERIMARRCYSAWHADKFCGNNVSFDERRVGELNVLQFDVDVLQRTDLLDGFIAGQYCQTNMIQAMLLYYFQSYKPPNIALCNNVPINSLIQYERYARFKGLGYLFDSWEDRDIMLAVLHDQNLNHHFTVAVFNPKEFRTRLMSIESSQEETINSRSGVMIVLDSLADRMPQKIKRLLPFLTAFCCGFLYAGEVEENVLEQQLKLEDFDQRVLSLTCFAKCPKQTDGCSCGWFSTFYAEMVLRGRFNDFTFEDWNECFASKHFPVPNSSRLQTGTC
eukprot:scaffold1333_cov326-Ochromonas_danica.AAC.3